MNFIYFLNFWREKMTKKERLKSVFPILQKKFGIPKAALEFETSYQLMVAVILSAQCTDERVNIVTKELFKVVREPKDIREMNLEILEMLIFNMLLIEEV